MNTTELKKLAEAATPWHAGTYREFHAAANPAAILKLLAINAELVEALKGVIESRDKNSFAREVYVTAEESDLGPYWSPAATMIDSHAIAQARAALAKAEGGEL